MADSEKLSVSLPADMVAGIRALVQKGDYTSPDEVVEEALWHWAWERRFESPEFREEIGRLWDEGIASGPALDGEEVFKRLRDRIKARAASQPAK